jgi:hypothetical protein
MLNPIRGLVRLLIATSVITLSAANAAGNLVERLATCQESWYDDRDDPVKMNTLVQTLGTLFKESRQDQSLVPKGRVTVAGLPVTQVYPQSIGMGVGFSIFVDAPFERAKAAVEKAAGKTLAACQTSDGVRACDAEIAPQRILTVLTGEDGKGSKTLIGCYYFYEK